MRHESNTLAANPLNQISTVIVDLAKESLSEVPVYDLCIVGSGPAGATVAIELLNMGLKICILESGRKWRTPRGNRLRRVVSKGLVIKDYSRERVLGGSSTTWAGLSAPLDPIDFRPRPWLSLPGWPFGREDLEEYYQAASQRYGFPPFEMFDPTLFRTLCGPGELSPSWHKIREKMFIASQPPQNFGHRLKEVIADDGATDLYLDATAQRVEAEHRGAHSVLVRNTHGSHFQFRARAFVLAAGGIENARLLLLSNLGNEHDQVGRGFMNHPKGYRGTLRLASPVKSAPLYFGFLHNDIAAYAGMRLREDLQNEDQLLNSYVRLEPLFPWTDSAGVEAIILLAKRSQLIMSRFRKRARRRVVELRDYSESGDDSKLQNENKGVVEWFSIVQSIINDIPRIFQYLIYRLVPGLAPTVRYVRLRNFIEMEPNSDNRVLLSPETDDDDRPLPIVKSSCTALDRRSIVRLHEELAEEIERQGLGDLNSDLATVDPWPIDQDASHHLGTTRMGVDPHTAVVTPDSHLFNVPNVYLAGGSVFPTSGCANPTYTIVALSIRLAKQLRSKLMT